jgi:tetratricopeptide (TPR) repeat protein
MARAFEGLGRKEEARAFFERAATGLDEPRSAMYYNDQPPDMIYYRGLALARLGRTGEARELFERLLDYGRSHLDDAVTFDYFAVSLPDFLVFDDDLTHRNRTHCHYMMGLGHLGAGEVERAGAELQEVLRLDMNHLGALFHLPTGRPEARAGQQGDAR